MSCFGGNREGRPVTKRDENKRKHCETKVKIKNDGRNSKKDNIKTKKKESRRRMRYTDDDEFIG